MLNPAMRPVRLLTHDPLSLMVQQRLRREVASLRDRIGALQNDHNNPRRRFMLDAYQRMLDRKLAFIHHWGLEVG